MTDSITRLIQRINGLLEIINQDEAVITALNNAVTELQAIEANTDGIEGLLTTINGNIVDVENLLTTINTREASRDWDSVIGNTITYTYYTGIVANNPSGNTNVATAVFSNGTGTIYTKTYAYDANDNVITITTT